MYFRDRRCVELVKPVPLSISKSRSPSHSDRLLQTVSGYRAALTDAQLELSRADIPGHLARDGRMFCEQTVVLEHPEEGRRAGDYNRRGRRGGEPQRAPWDS